MKQRLDKFIEIVRLNSHPARRAAFMYALLVFIGLLLAWWYIGNLVEERLLNNDRASVSAQLDSLGTSLTLSINQRLSLVTGLHSFVITEVANKGELETDHLEIFVSSIYTQMPGIRNIALAPEGVMQYVYPYEENKGVLGYEPARDERQNVRNEVRRAVETREIVLSLPYELIQGGQGLIARQAIFVNENYWGLANVVLDVPPLLEEAGISPIPAGLNLALRDQSDQVFYGAKDVFTSDPVIYSVVLPEGEWELAGIPINGWSAEHQVPLWVYRMLGLGAVITIPLLAYQLIDRRERLAFLVDQRTHELAQSNQALINVLEGIDADVYVADFDTHEILFANKHIKDSFNDNLVGKICYEVFRNESSVCAHCKNNLLFDTKKRPTEVLLWEDHNPITDRWYKNGDRAIRWHNGRFVHLQIATDITEHKQAQEEIQKQMQVQVALRKASAAISSTLDIETVLAYIAAALGQAIDSTSAYINSYDSTTEVSKVIAEYIGPGANTAERVSELGKSYLEDGYVEFLEMMQAGQHDVAHEGEADLSEYERAEIQEKGVKSILYIPLRIKGQLIGYAELRETRQHKDFTSEEIALCQDLAKQAALAIEHARLYGSIAQELAERKQAEVALLESEERYRNLFNSVPVGIYRSTPDGRFLDGNPAIMEILGYPNQETMLAAKIKDLYLDGSVREQELALIEQGDIVSNHQMQLRRYDGVVIWVQDSANAVRDSSGQTMYYYGRLEDITERMWTEMELQRANKQLQTQLAEIKKLEVALREQATRDPLTGVFNRRYMDEVLQQELARASRKKEPLSVVILDLDHLKTINDTYGHVAGGDKALQILADTLKQMCRVEDTLCRYGGDEFLVILHGTPAQVAYERVLQWREAVAGIKISSSEVKFGITFSAGMAAFPAHASTGEGILTHADRALYHAKELGRDQVVIYQKRSST